IHQQGKKVRSQS
ncbi:hypothetical protein Zm00014a_005074, partial [Zea mays]